VELLLAPTHLLPPWVCVRLDAVSQLLDYQQVTMGALQQSWAEEGMMTLPLPLALLAVSPHCRARWRSS